MERSSTALKTKGVEIKKNTIARVDTTPRLDTTTRAHTVAMGLEEEKSMLRTIQGGQHARRIETARKKERPIVRVKESTTMIYKDK